MNCGEEVKLFYSYCIFCGASTADNPKCVAAKKDAKPLSKENRKSKSDSHNISYIKGGWTRHDAFAQILHDNPPRSEYREGDIVVLNVLFNPNGHTYCYRAKDNVYRPGDIVEVKVNDVPKAVTVESVGYYSEEEYPFDVVRINYVEGMASDELRKKYEEIIEEESEVEAERDQIRKEAEERLRAIRTENDVIRNLKGIEEALSEDEEISKHLADLEIKMAKVIDRAEQMIDEDNSENINERIKKLYSVYLPKTISVLEQYKNIFSGGLAPRDVENLRADLLEAIDKSDQVYNNVLISLYEKDMLELTSEMEALKTMFALSGLLDSDFDLR